jgi:hypothetical protein
MMETLRGKNRAPAPTAPGTGRLRGGFGPLVHAQNPRREVCNPLGVCNGVPTLDRREPQAADPRAGEDVRLGA